MKHSKASQYIRAALICVQKVRSIEAEQSEGDPILRKVQIALDPKVHDDRWLLTPLLKLVERLDNGGAVTPMEFYNMMTIIDRDGMSIQASYMLASDAKESFPVPDPQWLRGWEKEDGD